MIHFIGFDIETAGEQRGYGLQPYRVARGESRITSFAAVDESGLIIDRSLEPTREQLRAVLEHIAADPLAVAIGWNTVFDVTWLMAYGLEDVVRRIQWFDGQVLRRGLENEPEDYAHKKGNGWGLKPTVAKFLPEFAGYEQEVNGNFDVVDEALLQYNTLDSQLTAQLGRIMWDQIEARPSRIVQVICQCIPAFSRAWLDGVHLSRDAFDVWTEKLLSDKARGLEACGLDNTIIRSPAKLKAELIQRGYNVVSTDKGELSKFVDDPFIDSVRAVKRANTYLDKNIKTAHKCMDYHGEDKSYASPFMWGAYTGRCTYSTKIKDRYKKTPEQVIGLQLHQWPKKREGKYARACIVPPPGHLLTEYDFSNQESRVMADLAGDPTLLDIFNNGLDYHSTMGAKAARMPYQEFYEWYKSGDENAERFRQMGKVANLSLAYRTGPETFQEMARKDYDVYITLDEAVMLRSLYLQTYPGIPRYWYAAINLAKSRGYAETRGGRRVLLSKWLRGQGGYASEQTALNFPVQGTGADQKFLGIALTDAYAHARGARYMLDLHDALYYVIPDDDRAMETARTIKHILNTLPYKEVFGWTPRVPMPVDGKIGPSWGELKDIK